MQENSSKNFYSEIDTDVSNVRQSGLEANVLCVTVYQGLISLGIKVLAIGLEFGVDLLLD